MANAPTPEPTQQILATAIAREILNGRSFEFDYGRWVDVGVWTKQKITVPVMMRARWILEQWGQGAMAEIVEYQCRQNQAPGSTIRKPRGPGARVKMAGGK